MKTQTPNPNRNMVWAIVSANGKIVAFVKINMDESGTPLLQRFLADTIMHLIYFTFRELSVEEQHPSVCQTQMPMIYYQWKRYKT